jgi:AcrR family transcriptional regulator
VTQPPAPSPATPAEPVPPAAPTRRDRLRAATTEEITATARRLLVEQGPDAMSLRAIAREMGMTAPGLYRYYDSREELLRNVIASIFRELSADVRLAIDEVTLSTAGAAVARGNAAPEQVRRHLTLKLVAACRATRRCRCTSGSSSSASRRRTSTNSS